MIDFRPFISFQISNMTINKGTSGSMLILLSIVGLALLYCEVDGFNAYTKGWHGGCPYECFCHDNYTDVDCSNSSLKILPENIPPNVIQL